MSESEAVHDLLTCSKGQQSQQRIMANDLFLQSDRESEAAAARSSGHELDSFLGKAFEEKPIWLGLYENLRDVFFPPKLPPLELTSKPIPVPDRMKVRANPWAIGISTVVNGSIVALLLFLGVKSIIDNKKKDLVNVNHIEVTEFIPPKAANNIGGGGGQGNHQVETPKGHLPPRAETHTPVIPKELIAPVQTIDVQKDLILPDDPKLPNIGLHNSPNVKFSAGGYGSGGGIGSGHGTGLGDGSGGNTGGGLYKVGGAVSEPKLIFAPEAEFSDEARRAKYQGIVVVQVIVDAQGNPQNPRVVRPLGMGLDEKALEAIRKYRFKPSMKDGKTPVPVLIAISIDFHLY
jgi:TonB family protein